MNKYEIDISVTLEASNQEAAEDMVREILEGQPDFIEFEVVEIASIA